MLDPVALAEAQEVSKREHLRKFRREMKIPACDVRAEAGRHLVVEPERWKGTFRSEYAELMHHLRGRLVLEAF